MTVDLLPSKKMKASELKDSRGSPSCDENCTTPTNDPTFTSVLHSILEDNSSSPADPIISEHTKRLKEEEKNQKQHRKLLKLKKEKRDYPHIIPSIFEKEHERGLKRIALKGVIKLFNNITKFQETNGDLEELDAASSKGRKQKRGKFSKNPKNGRSSKDVKAAFARVLNS